MMTQAFDQDAAMTLIHKIWKHWLETKQYSKCSHRLGCPAGQFSCSAVAQFQFCSPRKALKAFRTTYRHHDPLSAQVECRCQIWQICLLQILVFVQFVRNVLILHVSGHPGRGGTCVTSASIIRKILPSLPQIFVRSCVARYAEHLASSLVRRAVWHVALLRVILSRQLVLWHCKRCVCVCVCAGHQCVCAFAPLEEVGPLCLLPSAGVCVHSHDTLVPTAGAA